MGAARQVWQRILFDRPGFELEAGALTLPEIQQRAASFDPLTQETDESVRAISGNAWFSLGRRGLGLHFERRPGKPSEALVLLCAARGKRWEVSIDRKVVARFSTSEAAVEAVDYEIGQMGRAVLASAHESAAWRRTNVPTDGAGGSAGASPFVSLADALRLAVWQRVQTGR